MLRALALAALIGAAALPARAELIVCNETAARHSVAIAYADGPVWVSEGWWNIAAGACKTVVSGALRNRYYYYRATAPGRRFDGERYFFCVQPEVFTIRGDKDCEARGYARAEFRSIDTGPSARRFTVTLRDAASAAPPAFAPGSFGEPFATRGLFQGCAPVDGGEVCEVVADGAIYAAYAGAGTAPSLMASMRGIAVNTPVEISGDVIALHDVTVEIALARLALAEEGRPDGRLSAVQGLWESADDPAWQIEIRGVRRTDLYDGELIAEALIAFDSACPESLGAGPVMLVTELPLRETACFVVGEASETRLTLYPAGTGNRLRFRRPR